MKRNLINTIKFATLPLLLLMSCDLANESEFYVGFLSGAFNNWDHGSDKQLQFLMENKETGEIVVLGSSRISEDGSFSIDSLMNPPDNFLEEMGDGPGNEMDECVLDYEISDPDVMIGFGFLAITKSGTNEIIGKAYKATSEMIYDSPDIGQSIIEYIYVESDVSIIGSEICNSVEYNFTHTTDVIAYFNAGWNQYSVKAVSRGNNSEVKEITDGEVLNAEWFFKIEGDDNYNGQPYPFILQGVLEFWDGTTDKMMVLGIEDFQQGGIIKFAETNISSTGQFSFSQAVLNQSIRLMPITDGPAAPRECSINLTASDVNAHGISARLFITKEDEVVGEAGLGFDVTNNGELAVGNFFVEIIFADRNVRVQGEVDCSDNADSRYGADITNVDINLTEGWNFASRVITNVDENNNITAEIHEGILPNARWYWRFY